MSEYPSTQTLLIASVFFLAGIVKGVTGMGLPTVAMGVLGAVMSPVMAASLLIIPSFATNVWQLLTGPSFAKLIKRLWLMLLGIVIGTIVGVSSPDWLRRSVDDDRPRRRPRDLCGVQPAGATAVAFVTH